MEPHQEDRFGKADELRGRVLQLKQTKAVHSFWSIVSTNSPRVVLQHFSRQLPSSYSAEWQVVGKHFTPILMGLGAFAVVLTSFRVTGTVWFRKFRHVYIFGKRSPPPMKRFQDEAEKRWPFWADFALSGLFGVAITFWELDTKDMKRELVETPLLPGRSLISEYMCSDLIKSHKKYPPEVFSYLDMDSSSLQSFDEIVFNCHVRNRFESLARERNGLSENQPVVVPSPGLFQLAYMYDDERD